MYLTTETYTLNVSVAQNVDYMCIPSPIYSNVYSGKLYMYIQFLTTIAETENERVFLY